MPRSVSACLACGLHILHDSRRCHACGAALSPHLASGTGPVPQAPVWITTANYRALGRAARQRQGTAGHAAAFLLRELDRAVVCAPEWIAPDVVTMNSRIVFTRGAGAAPEERVLVYPDRYEANGRCVSVLSPLGAALIGLAAGSSLPFRDRDGAPHAVCVERVAYQPEARGRAAGAARPD